MNERPVLVTGGMGFIGFNAVLRYARRGLPVVVYDNLSRRTARRNAEEFRRMRLARVKLVKGDVRDAGALRSLFKKHGGFSRVVHLAAQVAVTTSVVDPAHDFDANARGTLNVLEAARACGSRATVLFASTNKVYGGLDGHRVAERKTRYELPTLKHGVGEETPLDFHSPYACSKGVADQYVRDYMRVYGLRTVVFRQSCIYGPWQYGEEDQGWIAWFLIAALARKPLSIYGTGKQVRDALFVDDLLDLYDAAADKPRLSAGRIFNAGGGPANTLSLLELLDWIRGRLEIEPRIRRAAERPGDQKIYVSDIRRARRELGWTPRVSVGAGLERMLEWLSPRISAAV